jgi:hypothetical protein
MRLFNLLLINSYLKRGAYNSDYSNFFMIKNKFLLGNWILRSTNDNQFKNGYTFLIVNDDNTIKLKTIYDENLITIKKSTTGKINNIENELLNSALLEISYTNYNIYSHSLFGIQLPEIKSSNKKFNIKKKFKVELVDQSLLITDTRTPLYYLFDLQIGKIKSPYIEISLYTFIFTQFSGILLNNILNNIL